MILGASLRDELTRLVRDHNVVLFMKGVRSAPQCGFSASVVQILDGYVPEYLTVDVLANPELRDGLKEFSDWPTFPQLYIGGEFVGGADIVREMHRTGELAARLGKGSVEPAPAQAPRVTVTDAAKAALSRITADPGDVLHLAIDGTYRYDFFFGPKEPSDIAADGYALFVDPASAARADGTVIDFVRGPGGEGFAIENPNAPPKVKGMTVQELKALRDEGAAFELIDVRTDGERATASIDGAVAMDDASARLGTLDKSKARIVVVCHHGVRSRAAAERLVRQGFRNVFNLEGGIDAWSREIDPSVPRY